MKRDSLKSSSVLFVFYQSAITSKYLFRAIERNKEIVNSCSVALAKRHNDRAFLKLNRAPSFYHYGALSPLHKATEGHNAIKIERYFSYISFCCCWCLKLPVDIGNVSISKRSCWRQQIKKIVK
jgi:hypothetical protein